MYNINLAYSSIPMTITCPGHSAVHKCYSFHYHYHCTQHPYKKLTHFSPARHCASANTNYGLMSVTVCLSQIGVLSKRIDRSCWFLEWTLLYYVITVAEIQWFNSFHRGGRTRHIGLFRNSFLRISAVKKTHFTQPHQISQRSIKPLHRYRDYCDFQYDGRRHLEFSKIRNFNGRFAVTGRYLPGCQISSKSVKRLKSLGV